MDEALDGGGFGRLATISTMQCMYPTVVHTAATVSNTRPVVYVPLYGSIWNLISSNLKSEMFVGIKRDGRREEI